MRVGYELVVYLWIKTHLVTTKPTQPPTKSPLYLNQLLCTSISYFIKIMRSGSQIIDLTKWCIMSTLRQPWPYMTSASKISPIQLESRRHPTNHTTDHYHGASILHLRWWTGIKSLIIVMRKQKNRVYLWGNRCRITRVNKIWQKLRRRTSRMYVVVRVRMIKVCNGCCVFRTHLFSLVRRQNRGISADVIAYISARKGTHKETPSLVNSWCGERAIRAIFDKQINHIDELIAVCSQQAAYLPCSRVDWAFQTADRARDNCECWAKETKVRALLPCHLRRYSIP